MMADLATPRKGRAVEAQEHASDRFQRVAQSCGAVVIAIGSLALMGWLTRWQLLTSLRASYIPMAPNTAFSFILLGTALWLSMRASGRRWLEALARIMAGVVAVVVFLRLVEFVAATDLGTDWWVFQPAAETLRNWKTFSGLAPVGKMSFFTALNFLAASLSLLLAAASAGRRMNINTAGALGTVVMSVGLVFSLGYLYGAPLFYGGSGIPMALNTALAFLALGAGLVAAAGPSLFLLRPLLGGTTRARLLRAFLPFTVIAICVVAWLTSLVISYADASYAALLAALLAVTATLLVSVICARIARVVGRRLEQAQERIRHETDERRRAEEQLRASEARYGSLFESAQDAIAVTDEDGKLLEVNHTCCALFGANREELLRATLGDLIGAPEIRERLPGLLQTFQETGVLKEELAVLPRGGSRRVVELSGVRFAPGLYINILRDITERKTLERQLQQAQKMESIGTLAGGIAHDFNNILTGIIGFASLALRKAKPDDPLRHDLAEIKKQGERAAALTRKLLAFSRQQILEPKNVDLNQLIAEAGKFLRRVIGAHIELKIATAPQLATVYVDPVQIEQVLVNLCINARDAMPAGGQLLIETHNVHLDEAYCQSHPWARPGDYAQLTVSDTGTGMGGETMAHIFEPFFTTKEVGKGTGLGLAMVYGIVKQHDGLIHVYSEPGQGTTFKIYLKAVAAPAESLERGAVETPRPGNETLLVAEDEETVRKLAVQILAAQGYTVLTAANGEEALRVFAANRDRIEMVLLDVVMPRVGGREVYEILRAQKPALKFLFMSGYSVGALHERFILDAGLEFVHKPFDPLTLARRVREVLDKQDSRLESVGY
jgi:two-component system cell cycle sensor histidine kinase/response regulator CckA